MEKDHQRCGPIRFRLPKIQHVPLVRAVRDVLQIRFISVWPRGSFENSRVRVGWDVLATLLGPCRSARRRMQAVRPAVRLSKVDVTVCQA